MVKIESRRIGLIINGDISTEKIQHIFYNTGIKDIKWTKYESINIIAITLYGKKKFTSTVAFRPHELVNIESFRNDELLYNWYVTQCAIQIININVNNNKDVIQ